MKKLSLMLIYLLICLLLTGCSIVPELKDFDIIHNKEYYSVFLQQDEEKTYFIKGTDVNGNNDFIRAYSDDKTYTLQDAANSSVLSNAADFDLCGEKNLMDSFMFVMITTTNNESYLYKKKSYFGYEWIKVDYTFKPKTRNIAYISVSKNNDKYMFNENIGLYSIETDEFNNTYLQGYNEKMLLLENIDVINSFFMIDYYDAECSYYPFIIISNKTAYFYVVNNEMELIYNNKYEFNENIIDYNFCCTYNTSIIDRTSYFYIISGNNMYLYNNEGNEIKVIPVDDNLINASIYFKYNTETNNYVLNVDLIYSGSEDKIIKLIRREIIV